MNTTVTIIGMGDDGCAGLTSRAVNAVAAAQVLAGGERQLDFFPQFQGQKVPFKSKITDAVEEIGELSLENRVCVLASGDPLFFGIGNLILKKVGAEHVEVIPHPSSMQWAFAKAGLKWDDADFLSFHGRPLTGFLTRLKRMKKVACFTDEKNSPARIASHMLEYEEREWTAWVCENLGNPEERVRRFTLEDLASCEDIAPLNVLILQRNKTDWKPQPALSYLHEDDFAKRMPKKGLITKREVRTLTLASLQIRPDSVVWDIGAGSGSVSIEAAMLAYEGKVFAVEVDPEGVQICEENCKSHAVDNVTVIEGKAPDALQGLADPDAVFVGGSKGNLEKIMELSLERLKPGGRLVVNAITLDNVNEAYTSFRKWDYFPEVIMLNISRGAKLARYLRYEALNPIHIFSVTKE